MRKGSKIVQVARSRLRTDMSSSVGGRADQQSLEVAAPRNAVIEEP
jgi:hypothetical protein